MTAESRRKMRSSEPCLRANSVPGLTKLQNADRAKCLIYRGSPGRIRTSDQPVNSRFDLNRTLITHCSQFESVTVPLDPNSNLD